MQETLNLSKDGLKFHLRNIYTKLGVNKRVDAIRLAKQMGL
jgi:LuxR family transcriptional regulator, maltose regulon positive regulatory protein